MIRLRSVLTFLVKFIATGFYSGLSPVAPGTMGTIPGLLIIWLFSFDQLIAPYVLYLPILALGYWVIKLYEANKQTHDPREIVIDEMLGFSLIFLFIPVSWPLLLAGFVCFRLFDMTKIGPVGWCERTWHGTPMGTLLDDLMAGLLSVFVIQVFIHIGLLS
ncbi:MAG: phosphatidylglycerophosphatase A [Proteobacteria bacterium]|nr:phosphatidylglycerophosphatase A [Pseudomonadota bacterium]